MSNLYSNLNEKKFKILTIIGCFVADLFTAGYIYEKMAKEEQFKDAVAVSFELAKTYNPQLQDIPMANIYNELWQMFMLMLASIILFFLLIHSLIYIAHYYDKSFAYSYTKLYAWSGGILMTLFAIINLLTPPAGLFLIPGAILLFIAVGMKRFPFKSKEE